MDVYYLASTATDSKQGTYSYISDPRAVLYGSQRYFGYVLEDPYLRQGITKLIALVQEAMNRSLTR